MISTDRPQMGSRPEFLLQDHPFRLLAGFPLPPEAHSPSNCEQIDQWASPPRRPDCVSSGSQGEGSWLSPGGRQSRPFCRWISSPPFPDNQGEAGAREISLSPWSPPEPPSRERARTPFLQPGSRPSFQPPLAEGSPQAAPGCRLGWGPAGPDARVLFTN